MNYAYLFVDNLNGHSYENGLNELRASVATFKNIQKYDSIHVFNNEVKGKNINYFKKENIIHNTINLSRNYMGSDNGNPISILVEKIIQLMNFDEEQDIVLMDIDTSSQKTIPGGFFNSNWVVFDNIEYPIMQWRNLDKVLPQIPWKQFDVNFDSSFMMYNTGVIYIPKKFRKELCEKALNIVDYLNNNFDPNERFGNKLDEQIALSIVCHDTFGRFGHIKYSSEYLHHHWDDRQNGIKWWESINSQYENFDIIEEKNNCTLVTGLWDINRVNLNGIWKRSFDEYIEKFTRLLKTDNNLIIFGDKNLRDIVFKYRDDKNTQFIQLDSSWFRNTSYYPLIQKIRTDEKWINQKEWIKDSPQATLELYNPVVMSKMPLMDIAIEQSKFNVDYFYWVDAGIRSDPIHFSKQVLEDIGDYSQFFFTCFPYIDTEIHGFDTNKVKEIILDDPTMVARATFWGGNKDRIKRINSLYKDLMHKTLNEGFMGTEETLFTILTYKNPDLIDYYKMNESNNTGDPTDFLQRFKESENKSDLFVNIKKNTGKISVVQIGTNHAYDDLSNYLISNYEDNNINLILLVEPNRFHNPSIKKCYEKYSNVIIENIAVKPSTNVNNKMTIFYRDFVGGNFEVASCSLDHVSYHDYVNGNINSFEVSCLSLEELLDKYSIKTLDWLLLDIEGIDSEVILNFDWERYDIKKVEFEHLHLGEKKEIIKEKFFNMGYRQSKSLHHFDWAFER